jgi:ankyrin repeat protein
MSYEDQIKMRDRDGNTALHRAVLQADLREVTRLLEDEYLYIDTGNNRGESPLHLAVTYKHIHAEKIAALLLKHGASVNIWDKSCNNFLHSAASAGCTWAVTWLLDNGCDNIVLMNDFHELPLSLALKRYMDQIITQEECRVAHARGRNLPLGWPGYQTLDQFDHHHNPIVGPEPDPAIIRILIDHMMRFQIEEPFFWVDYWPTDPIFRFFSNEIPILFEKQIINDKLDRYYLKGNRIYKSWWGGVRS